MQDPRMERHKKQKGRVPVRTGGSTKVHYGEYGMRLKDIGLRISAKVMQTGENIIRRNVPKAVCTKGNESRMGRGKGSFEYWACRVPVGKVVFELPAFCREEQAKHAFRQAAAKMPGQWEFIDRTAKPKIGLMEIEPHPKDTAILGASDTPRVSTMDQKRSTDPQLTRQKFDELKVSDTTTSIS